MKRLKESLKAVLQELLSHTNLGKKVIQMEVKFKIMFLFTWNLKSGKITTDQHYGVLHVTSIRL